MAIVEQTKAQRLPLSRAQRNSLLVGSLLVTDVLAILAAFALANWLRFEQLAYGAQYEPLAYLRLTLVAVPTWLAVFFVLQLYNPERLLGGLQEYVLALEGVSIGALLVIVWAFFDRESLLVSRGWLILAWVLSMPLVVVGRLCVRRSVYAARKRGHLLAPALIVGANEEGCALAEQLCKSPTSGLAIAGFVDANLPVGAPVCAPSGAPHGAPAGESFRVVGRPENLEWLVRLDHIEEVIVAPTALHRPELLNLFSTVALLPDVHLRMSSGLFEILTTGLHVKELAYVPLIEVERWRYTGLNAVLKALMDYGASLVVLLLLWPVLLLVGLAVRLDSRGPAIYRRTVVGVNGKPFDAFKFRTMRMDGDAILAGRPELQEELARTYKLKDDPRVTRLGRLLRKYSLDELPQVFNVLRGQMSWVGPRMISPPEMAEYGKWGRNLLTVKPGLTGLWQISGRSDVSYEERVRLDMHYIRNWTIWLDLYIFFATIPAVILKRGSY